MGKPDYERIADLETLLYGHPLTLDDAPVLLPASPRVVHIPVPIDHFSQTREYMLAYPVWP